jgi:tetratricopeptide (TPR) repeat protein
MQAVQDFKIPPNHVMAAKGEHVGWFKKGQSFFEWKQYKQALAAFDKAIKAKPNYIDAWADRGKTLIMLGEMEQAIQAFDKVVKLAPAASEGHLLKVMAMDAAGQVEAALDYSQQLTIDFKEESSVFLFYGNLLNQYERYEAAIATYSQALKQPDDNVPMLLLGRSYALEQLERYEAALSDLERITVYGDFYAIAKTRAGVLEKLERYDEALQAYNIATADEPSMADGWLGKGLLLEKLERFEEAINWYGLSIFSIGAEGWLMRGQLQQRLKQYETALDSFAQALTLEPNYPSAHYDRAVCLIQQGNPSEALAALTQAIGLNPDLRALTLADPLFATCRDQAEWSALLSIAGCGASGPYLD